MKCDNLPKYAPAYIWIGLCSWIVAPIFLYFHLLAIFYSVESLIITLACFGLLVLGYFAIRSVRKCTGSFLDAIYAGFGVPSDTDFQKLRSEMILPNTDIITKE